MSLAKVKDDRKCRVTIRPDLALVGGSHEKSNRERLFSAMARVAAEPNGFWQGLAIGATGLIVAMLGWFLISQAGKLDDLTRAVNELKVEVARYH
jgi:hypothetical protein